MFSNAVKLSIKPFPKELFIKILQPEKNPVCIESSQKPIHQQVNLRKPIAARFLIYKKDSI